MVAFIGNTLSGKVSGENFDESITSRQNSSDFPPVKVLHYTVAQKTRENSGQMETLVRKTLATFIGNQIHCLAA